MTKTTTATPELPTATPKNNDYAQEWAILLEKQASENTKIANKHRTERARFVLKMHKAGYSGVKIAEILGISEPEAGRLTAFGVADSAGIPLAVTDSAIRDGVSISKIKKACKAGSKDEIKAQLESIGLVNDKDSGPARETSTIKTRTDKAIVQLRKIESDAKLGKIALVTIASILQEIADTLGDFEGLCSTVYASLV